MHNFENDNGCTVTYDSVRKAMNGEPFTMSLTERDEGHYRWTIEATAGPASIIIGL